MAAAVADYRPRAVPGGQPPAQTKLKRGDGPITLELESTPDLLAGVTARKRPGQVFIGFALEPAERLIESARAKLERKRLDLIVANPLETMDSPLIEATVLGPRGVVHVTQPPVDKAVFAQTLLDLAADAVDAAHRAGGPK
jgi:phosphopantothenoylcysteine decarboxylase/phosphopantothenate--cysteine ligase